jgi:hypothetical protein
MRTVITARWFPMPGSAIPTGFTSWRLVSPASVMDPSSLAIIITYDNSYLWDFERLVLWWRHVGLMARLGLILVSISRVVLVRRRWISLMALAMWLVIGGYWDGIFPVASFSSLDF